MDSGLRSNSRLWRRLRWWRWWLFRVEVALLSWRWVSPLYRWNYSSALRLWILHRLYGLILLWLLICIRSSYYLSLLLSLSLLSTWTPFFFFFLKFLFFLFFFNYILLIWINTMLYQVLILINFSKLTVPRSYTLSISVHG